jgi:ADP-ribosylglycohydrolase
MLPLVYYVDHTYGKDINEYAVDFIYKVSSLTHAHEISKVACVYYVYIGIAILHDRENKSLQDIITRAVQEVDQYYAERDTLLGVSLLEVVKYEEDFIQSTGYVVHSLGASLWSIWNTGSYKKAVLTAVNLGGDTDTIGAITGSLAGLYYGFDNIPVKWLGYLKNKDLISRICHSFYEKHK